MTADDTPTDGNLDEPWDRYGRALLQGMQEVLAETPADVHALLLETADYWLSLGLSIGATDPDAASRLLAVIESEEPERAELAGDAVHFIGTALG